MDNAQYGKMGSIVFGGLAVGSVLGTLIFNQIGTKWILILSLVINALVLYGVTLTINHTLLGFFRFMTGFSQVFMAIFLPVWADKFAPNEQAKTCWLTGVLLASTVGVLMGYVMTAFFIQ